MLKVQEIRELIKLIDQSSIDEFTYETNGTSVTMKKTTHEDATRTVPTAVSIEQPVVREIVEEQKNKEEVIPNEKETIRKADMPVNGNVSNYDHEIVSPMVGTFYSSPDPDSDPFVTVGSHVDSNSVVCIVEAMKLFNEIEAEVSGEIMEILVDNGELVEYGQPLFRVKTK